MYLSLLTVPVSQLSIKSLTYVSGIQYYAMHRIFNW